MLRRRMYKRFGEAIRIKKNIRESKYSFIMSKYSLLILSLILLKIIQNFIRMKNL